MVGHYITLKETTYSYFAGNDYLGLANHPLMVKDAIDSLKKYGINFSASRQTTGTSNIHLELENLLADFKKQEDAIVFASGYLGNSLLLKALEDDYSMIFMDSNAHPSISDGISKNFTNVHQYDHCNSNHLESLLKKSKKSCPLIITDGIFPLTGEIAPLQQIYSLAEKYNALVIVDDAHASGILGKNGRGTPEYFNLDGKENLFQSETMSKALGAYGGFICAEKKIIDRIRYKSTFYGASTALPPPIVAAGCSSIRLLKKQHSLLRDKLVENTSQIKTGIRDLGFETTNDPTPIIPIFFKTKENADKLSVFLKANKIIVPSIDYPVKMNNFIVRITASAKHTKDQIENLIYILKKWRAKYGTD